MSRLGGCLSFVVGLCKKLLPVHFVVYFFFLQTKDKEKKKQRSAKLAQ